MITVIKEGKTPIYQVECYECKSVLRYTRADVSLMHITCPICKCSVNVCYRSADEVEDSTDDLSNEQIYELQSSERDYCEMYEPTYNPEDGSM